MATIEELAARVFVARDLAHRAHWATRSYSKHMALGSFYDDAIDKIDGIVETVQGASGLIGLFNANAPAADGNPDTFAGWLATEAQWIAANRDGIAGGNTAVANLIDGLLETYYTTIYKLVNLA